MHDCICIFIKNSVHTFSDMMVTIPLFATLKINLFYNWSPKNESQAGLLNAFNITDAIFEIKILLLYLKLKNISNFSMEDYFVQIMLVEAYIFLSSLVVI